MLFPFYLLLLVAFYLLLIGGRSAILLSLSPVHKLARRHDVVQRGLPVLRLYPVHQDLEYLANRVSARYTDIPDLTKYLVDRKNLSCWQRGHVRPNRQPRSADAGLLRLVQAKVLRFQRQSPGRTLTKNSKTLYRL